MFSTFLKSSIIHVLTKSIAQKSVKSKVPPPINTIIGALFSLHSDIFSSGTRSIKRISKKIIIRRTTITIVRNMIVVFIH